MQKQAELGYLLIAVENFGSFYTFSFESAPPLDVYKRQDEERILRPTGEGLLRNSAN